MIVKCPECGVALWKEAGGYMKHPTTGKCKFDGQAFPMKKKNHKDRRVTVEDLQAMSRQKAAPAAKPKGPVID